MDWLLDEHGIHVFNWINHWLLAGLVGLLLSRLYMWPARGTAAELPVVVTDRWRSQWRLRVLLVVINSLWIFALSITTMMQQSLTTVLSTLWPLLTQTHVGEQWLGRLWLLILLVIVTWPWRRKQANSLNRVTVFNGLAPIAAKVGLILLVGVAFTLSSTSHAANQGNFTVVQIAHWLHLCALWVWAGSIVVFHEHMFSCLRADLFSRQQVVDIVDRFSRVCAWSVGVVLASGAIVSVYLIVQPQVLITSEYGQYWLVKVSLVVAMLVVAGLNRWRWVPALRDANDNASFARALQQFKTAITCDWVLVLLVLFVAADMAHLTPPVDTMP